MSSFFLRDGIDCPALPLRGGTDGHPVKFVYWYDQASVGGPAAPLERYTGENVCRVPDDDGASWTVGDLGRTSEEARGAHLYVEIVGEVSMIVVNQRLDQAQKYREALVAQMTAGAQAGTGTEFEELPTQPIPVEPFTRPQRQVEGFTSKADWKAAKENQ